MKKGSTVSDNDLSRTEDFKYLGIMLPAKSKLLDEITSNISGIWIKWHSTTGIICDLCIKISNSRMPFASGLLTKIHPYIEVDGKRPKVDLKGIAS